MTMSMHVYINRKPHLSRHRATLCWAGKKNSVTSHNWQREYFLKPLVLWVKQIFNKLVSSVCCFSVLCSADIAVVQLVQDPAGRKKNRGNVFGTQLIQNVPHYRRRPWSDPLSFMFTLCHLTWALKMPKATWKLAMSPPLLRRRAPVRGKNEALFIQNINIR